MANLIALTPCDGLLPISEGSMELREVALERCVSVAPFEGKQKAASDALKAQVSAGLPAVNRRSGAVTWFGHGTWMLAGDVSLHGLAAVTDQSDAWAVVSIAGAGVEDVLARLVPVDLRPSAFKTNHVAKTMLGHMSVTITRTGPAAFEIMAMRSMAATLVHELQVAMRGVALRA
ncbi:sarcosine oxidase subunit gamma [Loktanella sp. Alg231-35]|uniref:sarcosine oxidase subunit gamma n=1 Tax=Loktanella sp. Alg231-35 TaxID=1922220 RepID=UPI001F18355C|nr:sarcosine oxidase subunit gamma [Loktanella sp. Alg231-35]